MGGGVRAVRGRKKGVVAFITTRREEGSPREHDIEKKRLIPALLRKGDTGEGRTTEKIVLIIEIKRPCFVDREKRDHSHAQFDFRIKDSLVVIRPRKGRGMSLAAKGKGGSHKTKRSS